MSSFLKRRLIDPLIGFLKQGTTPSQLALAVSLGIVIATIPLFGSTTILCLLAIWIFRVNPAAVLLVNQFAYPLQFACYFPLIRLGEWTFDHTPIPFSMAQIFEMFTTDLFGAVAALWWSTVYGVFVWLLLSIPVTYILFYFFKTVFIKVKL